MYQTPRDCLDSILATYKEHALVRELTCWLSQFQAEADDETFKAALDARWNAEKALQAA